MLSACPSAAHRALLKLVALAVSGHRHPGLERDLARAPVARWLPLAHVSHALPVLPEAQADAAARRGLPDDLWLFLAEMRRGNADRNARLAAQLAELSDGLERAGVEVVALKGMAEILAPTYADPAARFVSDLDLLVPEEATGEVGRILAAAGYAAQDDGHPVWATHHHRPPFLRRAEEGPVELHLRIGPGAADRLLPAAAVRAAALPSALPGVRVPAPLHRAMHLAAHGRLGPRHFSAGVPLSLRDLHGFHRFGRVFGPATMDEASARFAAAGQAEAWETLEALSAAVLDPDALPRLAPEAIARARRGLRAYGQPGRRRAGNLAAWLAHYGSAALSDRRTLGRYLSVLRSPERRRSLVALHGARVRDIL